MKRILVTDDDELTANICRRKFEEAGYHVTVAPDGHAAVEELVLHPPDVLLLDLMLPEMDGIGVLRFLRSRPRLRHLPVVILSNSSYFSGVVQAAWSAGATLFFNKKETTPSALVGEVTELLASAAATQPPEQPLPPYQHAPPGTPPPASGFHVPPPLPPRQPKPAGTQPQQQPHPFPDRPAAPAFVFGSKPSAAAAPGTPPPPPPSAPRGPTRVLVADDDPLIHGVLGFFLKNAGFAVTQANNGRQALEMAESRPPDLLVLDGMMPEMSGFEVLKHWHRIPSLAPIPVIMLTGEKDESKMAEALGSGAVAYLTKPFSPDALVQHALDLTAR